MATYVSPSGFSYAQAAKGATNAVTSQTLSSKVTSGTASPANGVLAEVSSGSNWADDVEASVGVKSSGAEQKENEEIKAPLPNQDSTERVKAEEKSDGAASARSSPDLSCSANTITKEDYDVPTQNGTFSESTSDTKSQTSEPAWIADRKERQNGIQSSEKPSKGEKKGNEVTNQTPPKQFVLQPAAPPSFNVWTQRAENQKAKMTTQPKPSSTAPHVDSTTLKENQRPQHAPRKKANSITGVPREPASRISDDTNGMGASSPAANGIHHDSALTHSAKPGTTDRGSEQISLLPPPSVKDNVQWPTPDSVQEKDRKASLDTETESQRNEEGTPSLKGRKPQWTVLPVVPQYVPHNAREGKPRGPPNGERPSRNGFGTKGRGPQRGASNPMASADQERDNARSNSTPNNADSVVSTQNSSMINSATTGVQAPSNPIRSSSASPRRQQKKESIPGRRLGRQPTGELVHADSIGSEAGAPASSKESSFYKPFSDSRRVRSPDKVGPPREMAPDEFVPKPIPRRNSIGTQTDDVGPNVENNDGELPPSRPMQLESRKESRNGDSTRDGTRPGKRGGRGRGGHNGRELANGLAPFQNGYGTEFPTGPTYGGVTQSPSFQGRSGNHHYTSQPPRGAWRGGPRSHSIPIENYHHQSPRAVFPNGPHGIHGIQTFVPAMYDVNGYPMSAIPYSPQVETEHLMGLVTTQVEYYFSVNNLIKDMFLRKHMDSQGFVFLDIIANFNRIRQLTQDKELIKAVCINSQVIEIRVGEDGKERLRKREGWDQFCLPMDQRETSAQTAGPERLERPSRPQLSINGIPPQLRGPASAGLPAMHQRQDRHSYDAAYPMVNGYPHQFVAYPSYPENMFQESANGDEPRGRSAKSPIHEDVSSPVEQPLVKDTSNADSEPDSFPDDQVSILTVVVRSLNEQRPPYHSAASRTFSNGSIDSRSIMSEIQKSSESKPQALTNGESLVNGSDNKLSLTRTLTPSKSRPNDQATPAAEVNVFWVKEQDYPVGNLPTDLTPEPYFQLRQRALEDRNRAVTGNCPYDLDVLYQFWCHFLLRNFNHSMYLEFKHFAIEDARSRYNTTGLNNLVQFYFKSLSSHNPIRDRVVRDYVELVQNEPPQSEGAAFKTLRSAWRNGALNLKNRKKLADILDEKLKEQLDKVET